MNKAYRAAQRRAHFDVLRAHARANPLPRAEVLRSDHVNTTDGERAHVYIDRWAGRVRVSITIYDHILHMPHNPQRASAELDAEGERIAREIASGYGEVTRVLRGFTAWQAIVDHSAANAEPAP